MSRTLPSGVMVIRNGTIVDGTGRAPVQNGLVAIQAGHIVAVGPEAQFRIPGDAHIVDAQGGTILPGLIDAHAHVLYNTGTTQAGLGRWLRAGVTTIRDLGSQCGAPDVPALSIAALKQRLAAYGNTVPTLVIAGPLVTAPGGYPVPTLGHRMTLEVASVDEARQGVERLLADGADEVKIAVESWDPKHPLPTLSSEQVKAIVEIAHRKGTRVSAHVMRVADAQVALEGGVDDLAHLVFWNKLPDETIQQMVSHNTLLVPTLVIEDGMPGISEGLPLPELQRMVEFGMTPMQVIVAATSHAAQVCNLGQRLGTLEASKQADIVVVKGDPLANIQAMRDIVIVVKNGEVIVRP